MKIATDIFGVDITYDDFMALLEGASSYGCGYTAVSNFGLKCFILVPEKKVMKK